MTRTDRPDWRTAGVRVIKQKCGVFDTMPLSLLTTQALAGLGQLAGASLVAGRFRPNLVVDARGHGFPGEIPVKPLAPALRCDLIGKAGA